MMFLLEFGFPLVRHFILYSWRKKKKQLDSRDDWLRNKERNDIHLICAWNQVILTNRLLFPGRSGAICFFSGAFVVHRSFVFLFVWISRWAASNSPECFSSMASRWAQLDSFQTCYPFSLIQGEANFLRGCPRALRANAKVAFEDDQLDVVMGGYKRTASSRSLFVVFVVRRVRPLVASPDGGYAGISVAVRHGAGSMFLASITRFTRLILRPSSKIQGFYYRRRRTFRKLEEILFVLLSSLLL